MAAVTRIELSTWSLVKVILVGVLAWFLFSVREIIAILFVAIIFTAALEPWVAWFTRRKLPRVVGILVIYILVIAFVSLLIVLLLPPTIHQIQRLIAAFPDYWTFVAPSLSPAASTTSLPAVSAGVQAVASQVQAVFGGVENSRGLLVQVVNFFGGVFSLAVIAVMTFYLLLEENATTRLLRALSPARYQPYLTRILGKMRDNIGRWLRGQLALSAIIGLLVYIILRVCGLFYAPFQEYALILALLSFLLEFIPYLGPLLAAVPAVVIGFTHSFGFAVVVGLCYAVVQWSENNIIVPQVMRKAVGLSPIIVLVALLVGAKIGGVIGMVLAIPVTTALSVIAEEIFQLIDERE